MVDTNMIVIIKTTDSEQVLLSQRTIVPKEKPSFNEWTAYLHESVKAMNLSHNAKKKRNRRFGA